MRLARKGANESAIPDPFHVPHLYGPGRSVIASAPSKPRALVGFGDEWMRRSMEVVFQERGYEATKTASGREALYLARGGDFDVLMLDERIDELDGVGACSALRDDPLFDHSTPIVLVSSAHSSISSRTRAYRAGCWEYCHQPVDVDALFLKLDTFLRARRELATKRKGLLVDPATGLSTEFGLHELVEKLEARAIRNHEAIACLAFSYDRIQTVNSGTPAVGDTTLADLADLVRGNARRSDVVVNRGDRELALLAPETDTAGARLLVGRLQREIDGARPSSKASGVRLRVGVCAVTDLAAAKINLKEVIQRAEHALAQSVAGGIPDNAITVDELSP